MKQTATKLKKLAVLASTIFVLASPALALAQGEVYSWQDSNHQAVIATAGVYGSNSVTFHQSSKQQSAYTASNITDCQTDNGQASATLKLASSDAQAASDQPAAATLETTCTTSADLTVSVYKDAAAAKNASSSDNSSTSCKGGVLSYVVCPAYNFILDSINKIEQDFIIPFLRLNPIVVQHNSPTYAIWQQFRNLANIGFIIAFLVIIFATTLSINIDSYSLKKALPRLVMAAILVQFSYLLVAMAVDITNIIGAGLQALVLSPLRNQSSVLITNAVGIGGIAAGIAGIVALASGIITLQILVILVAAFFAIISVFLTLVARQILVTLLLILSPLAFVAWILPNTEHLFKVWRTMLLRLLMMYPMIVLLFASGKLFSSAAASTTGGAGTINSSLISLISVVAGLVPLFLIPFTFKFAGMALVSISTMITNAGKGLQTRHQSSASYERMKTRVQQRRTELAAGQKVKGFGLVTGNRASAQIARGIYTVPNNAANVRSMVNFNKETNDWKKRLEEENLGYEGVSYLSLGESWYAKERSETQGKIDAAKRLGNLTEARIQEEALDRLDRGRDQGKLYAHSSAAKAAAGLLRSDWEVLSDDDRAQLVNYTKPTQAGDLIANQMWQRMKEGVRKSNPHLAYTDIKGNVDAAELLKFVSKKPSGAWTDYSKDTIEVMAKPENHILQDLAAQQVTRQIIVNILSQSPGASIGAEQQQIIKRVLEQVPSPG
ncbi:MAG TPA: hypothetical protein VLE72_03575, partial [Candidatus Saccharimonadales bacterium]|nr:hypothetical protein [Candidatus Saccharimonadales bacterium]